MSFFTKFKSLFSNTTQQAYLVEIELDKNENSFKLKKIEDRNGKNMEIDYSKVFHLKENGNFPDELINYISELSGESVDSIRYHINE